MTRCIESVLPGDTSVENFQCDLTSLSVAQRSRRAQLAVEIWPRSLEISELANGYEFRFEFTPSLFANIGELAALEHLCCPFFEIALRLEKNSNRLWLSLTGDPGVKQFIHAELNP